MKSAKDDLKFI